MSKVAVLDTEKKVLAPCHPAAARRLLKEGKAAVFKRYPFTIILKTHRAGCRHVKTQGITSSASTPARK